MRLMKRSATTAYMFLFCLVTRQSREIWGIRMHLKQKLVEFHDLHWWDGWGTRRVILEHLIRHLEDWEIPPAHLGVSTEELQSMMSDHGVSGRGKLVA